MYAASTLGVLILVLGCGGGSPRTATAPDQTRPVAEPAAPEPSAAHRDMIVAIEGYLADPAGTPEAVRARIVGFAIESTAVQIHIDEHVVPFMDENDIDEELRNHLLAGFIAGNTATQLRVGVKRDDIHAGLAGALQVYRQVRAARPDLRSPSMDHLAELETRGQLKSHAERIRIGRQP
jgi:hypothetical protein